MSGLRPDLLDAFLDELVERLASRLRAAAPAPGPASPPPLERRLSVAEVAVALACTPAHVRALVRGGRLPVLRDGRRLLFRAADVEAYLTKPRTGVGRNIDELLLARHRKVSTRP